MTAIATRATTSDPRPRIAHFWWLSQARPASETSQGSEKSHSFPARQDRAPTQTR
jgi:hypothetical protein